jgi:hypothetical protein
MADLLEKNYIPTAGMKPKATYVNYVEMLDLCPNYSPEYKRWPRRYRGYNSNVLIILAAPKMMIF